LAGENSMQLEARSAALNNDPISQVGIHLSIPSALTAKESFVREKTGDVI